MPADGKGNGTAGRRGVYLITDAPGVAARARAIFDADADPARHLDIAGCDTGSRPLYAAGRLRAGSDARLDDLHGSVSHPADVAGDLCL